LQMTEEERVNSKVHGSERKVLIDIARGFK
jgi:hypothetical protein